METVSFADISIVSCGTMSLELNYLKKEGLVDTPQILYPTPGLHQDIPDLEHQLVRQINKAKEKTDKVVVIYGGKFCYVNADNSYRTIDAIIAEQAVGISISRINATHCMDMLASESQRQKICGGQKVWCNGFANRAGMLAF